MASYAWRVHRYARIVCYTLKAYATTTRIQFFPSMNMDTTMPIVNRRSPRHLHGARWVRAAIAITLTVAALSITGCAVLVVGAAGGVAGVAYVMGDLEAWVKEDPRTVQAATVLAFDSLQIRKVSSEASAFDAKVIGRTATDVKIQVTVKASKAETNKLSIRVGVFGDENISRKIHREIQRFLPQAATDQVNSPKNTFW